MSRIAKSPISIPSGVEIKIDDKVVRVIGKKGELIFTLIDKVKVNLSNNVIDLQWEIGNKVATALAGTVRAIVNNMVTGVSEGFERKLTLVGVGYRAQAKDKILSLSLGYSHPIEFIIPDEIDIETPNQTEIIIRGIDKQQVGQVAANIRKYRSPEPYKGKGVRYSDENVVRKEAKKK
jgi:large subunit ribosomal protein L6